MPNINIKLSKEELEYLKKLKGQLAWKEFIFYLIAKEEAWRIMAITWHKKQIKKLKQKIKKLTQKIKKSSKNKTKRKKEEKTIVEIFSGALWSYFFLKRNAIWAMLRTTKSMNP